MDPMGALKRTHKCNELSPDQLEQEVVLMGWVLRRRDHGGVIFIDLRDRWGITQIVFNPENNPEVHAKAHSLRSEWVLAVRGTVYRRPADMENTKLKTGAIEVMISELRVLNTSETPPFPLDEDTEVSDNLRLQYRYMDLRRPEISQNLILRHKALRSVRNFLDTNNFLEIETPMLTRSTPEGARDYLVPSRVNAGKFYALPQSPQLFKQLLMIAGMDRYYQVVKCFRDEDLRSDRQPEFTQIDMELSFVDENDIIAIVEGMIQTIFSETIDCKLTPPFKRMTYDESMRRFGTDRPDARFELELVDLTETLRGCGFKVFSGVIDKGGAVKAINAKNCAHFSRKDLDNLTEYATRFGAGGMAWIKIKEDEWQSPITKFFSGDEISAMQQALDAQPGDLILFGADSVSTVHQVLAELRLEVARRLDLIPKDSYDFLWITDFPLVEYDEKEKRYTAIHHPFTAPCEDQLDLLETDPASVKSRAYDLVLNGNEIGGGSIRIHEKDVQEKILATLGIDKEEGFLEKRRYDNHTKKTDNY